MNTIHTEKLALEMIKPLYHYYRTEKKLLVVAKIFYYTMDVQKIEQNILFSAV